MADRGLHEAACYGDIESLQELLTAGECNINVQDRHGRTTLHLAVIGGHTQCVQLVLQHGADTSIQQEDGWTPLHLAVIGGHEQCVQLLLQHGADPSKQHFDWFHNDGQTPLHLAAESGHTQCVQLLLQHGADTSIEQEDGWTPLHLAAIGGHTQCVQLLLQHGADPSIQQEDGQTPLHLAAESGHTQCVQLLLQHGADTSIEQKDGWTPLHLAAIGGHAQCVQLLLQHGVDPSIQQEHGRTTLHLAVIGGHTQCVQLVLQHGADPNIQDKDGQTPLHLASVGGHAQCMQLLLQHGADPSIQHFEWHHKDGQTPLHLAALGGHAQCVQLLLQHGADTSIQDKEKKTPRMLATEKKHLTIAEMLGRFEIPDIQGYVQTRTLEHLAEILEPAEYTFINQTKLSSNFPDVFQFQKVQGLKMWATKNNFTNIRDLRAGLQAANQPRLSSAAVEYYGEVVAGILNMAPDEFEALCRTLVPAKHMYTSGAATTDQQDMSSSVEPFRYDAFIAHSGKDKVIVEPVIEQLEERGVRCCYGRRDFHPGRSFITSMGEAIYGSRWTIVFLSKNFMESLFCAKESELAFHKAMESNEDVVIPVLMDLHPQRIPDEFKPLRYVLIKDNELILKLVQAIKGPTELPAYGELRNVLQNAHEENEFLKDQIKKMTTKLHQ